MNFTAFLWPTLCMGEVEELTKKLALWILGFFSEPSLHNFTPGLEF